MEQLAHAHNRTSDNSRRVQGQMRVLSAYSRLGIYEMERNNIAATPICKIN